MECKDPSGNTKLGQILSDLIDTLWNVKSGNTFTGQALGFDLIDTLWNVKAIGREWFDNNYEI